MERLTLKIILIIFVALLVQVIAFLIVIFVKRNSVRDDEKPT